MRAESDVFVLSLHGGLPSLSLLACGVLSHVFVKCLSREFPFFYVLAYSCINLLGESMVCCDLI